MSILTYSFKLNPTKAQQNRMTMTLDLCRELYNAALEERRTAYKKCGVSVSRMQQQKMLPNIKTEMPEFKTVYSQTLQSTLHKLDLSFQAFFRRVKRGEKAGFPRFQGKHRYNSFHYPQYTVKPADKHLYLPKIGNVRFFNSREIKGKIKTATVKRDSCGDWFVTFVCEVTTETLPKTVKSVGIDAGLTDICALSTGELIKAPKFFTKSQKALRKAQRKLARRKRGSKGRERARFAVAKIHRKIQRQRTDFLHKLSTRLVKEFDLIAIEDLNLQGLHKGILAKSFNDASISTLFQMLAYKAENAGKRVVRVNPSYTSQDCSGCGERQKMPLSERSYVCKACGLIEQRDVNAAKNILGRTLPRVA